MFYAIEKAAGGQVARADRPSERPASRRANHDFGRRAWVDKLGGRASEQASWKERDERLADIQAASLD